ncbi:MAG TPA: haloacid dehalogenase-like hydrolase [Polyangiaceae bacterium]|nr:haloacid dehalogenase-like hydrolase [Polyangiaceae bacterium]
MTPAPVTPAAVLDLLRGARVAPESGLAFDADGTIWSGDVGDDTFHFVCERELLREDPRDGLARVADAHGIDRVGTTSAVALRLFEGYRRGVVAEPLMCEVMTWCYAGYREEELATFAREAAAHTGLAERRRGALGPVFRWAADERLRTVVISASPRVVVETTLAVVGVTVDAIAAAVPSTRDGVIVPSMAAPLTYGPEKPLAGRRLLGNVDWLGSFGDNVFDLDMLRAARVGVAVHPKPKLRERLSELTNTVVLE